MKRRTSKPAAIPPTLTVAALELYAAARAAHDAQGLEAVCAAHRRWVIAQTAFDLAVESELAYRKREARRAADKEDSR